MLSFSLVSCQLSALRLRESRTRGSSRKSRVACVEFTRKGSQFIAVPSVPRSPLRSAGASSGGYPTTSRHKNNADDSEFISSQPHLLGLDRREVVAVYMSGATLQYKIEYRESLTSVLVSSDGSQRIPGRGSPSPHRGHTSTQTLPYAYLCCK